MHEMIFRVTDKLARKIKCGPLPVVPPGSNPYTDWAARLFTYDRIQYIMITNTTSLYTLVMYGRGVPDENAFIQCAARYMGEFLSSQGHALVFKRIIAPSMAEVAFSKASSRQVTGSMNDLEFQAKTELHYHSPSPYDLSVRLNEVPMSMLGMDYPKDAFLRMRASNHAL